MILLANENRRGYLFERIILTVVASRHKFKGGSLMRKMQDFIVKGKEIFIGLEDSKRSWKLCVRCDGMIIDETSMPARYDILRSYLKGRYPDCAIKVMYEAGFGGFWLHDYLFGDKIDCVVTPPNKVTQEKDNKVKCDKVDARRLALNLENGDYVGCHVPDRERREDRQISRTLNQIQKKIVSIKNQIRRFFDFHGLNGEFPSGAWNQSHYRFLKTLKLRKSLQLCLDVYLELLDKLEEMRDRLKLELKDVCQKDRYKRDVESKEGCPGVGWLTAIRLTLEWGAMSRFESGKHLASFTGLTCREHSTGGVSRKGRITGQSNGYVRAWLVQCAWRAIRQDPVLLDKFERVWKNSASKKKAIVAVARKLAVRMRMIELRRQPYCLGVIE
jgi:transposase